MSRSVSGLTSTPSSSRYSFRPPAAQRLGSPSWQVSSTFLPCALNHSKNQKPNFPFRLESGSRCLNWPGGDYVQRCIGNKHTHFVNCAMQASYGDSDGGDGFKKERPVIFPRIHERDLYKRLGISREADEDEIQAARNFLIKKYAGHEPSVEAIEWAHNKLIMEKYYERKKPKVDIGKKVREVKQSRFLQAVSSRFRTPSPMVIVKTSIVFLVLGALTVLFPTEDGPTLQVALSFMATVYFIHDRVKNKFQAILYGIGAFMFSWLFGTFLMVSVIPPLPFIKGLRSFEATTSLVTYVLMWISCTYFK